MAAAQPPVGRLALVGRHRTPESVCTEALRMFTRQLLTGAEAEAGADRHALTVDLAKVTRPDST
jgi:hypothetical protein